MSTPLRSIDTSGRIRDEIDPSDDVVDDALFAGAPSCSRKEPIRADGTTQAIGAYAFGNELLNPSRAMLRNIICKRARC